MDLWTFFDHFIGHAAWPATVAFLTLFVLVRRNDLVKSVVHRFQEVHVGPILMKLGPFGKDLAEGQAGADRLGLPPAQLELPKASDDSSTQLTDGSPRGEIRRLLLVALNEPHRAVTEAYEVVDHSASMAFHQIIDQVETDYGEGSPAVKHAAALFLRDPNAKALLDRLRDAASRAKDPSESISPGQAVDYVLLAARIVGYLHGYTKGFAKSATKPKE